MEGFVEAHRAGHALHVDLVRAILADADAWCWEETGSHLPSRRLFGHGLGLAQPVPA